MEIGRLQRLPLRSVWKHEAYDFSAWLEENIDVLNDLLGLNLSSLEREKTTGNFSVDLVGKDEDNRTIVIENQLGKSDHDHLGKIITYFASFDADIAIWIVADARPEHVNAFNWLNEISSSSFYLLKLEAVSIGDSQPAPILTVIVGPSEETRSIGETKRNLDDSFSLRYQFWESLCKKMEDHKVFHGVLKPNRSMWLYYKHEDPGIYFGYNVNLDRSAVAIYIDHGEESQNKATFDGLSYQKNKIEELFGEKLNWFKQENTRIYRIQFEIPKGYRNSEEWNDIQVLMLEKMSKLVVAYLEGKQI